MFHEAVLIYVGRYTADAVLGDLQTSTKDICLHDTKYFNVSVLILAF